MAPLFRKIDWLTFAVSTLVIFSIYVFTLAPQLTLQDSGELAVGSYYAGVPHPPGYPVWTIYTWLWANLLPWGNIAWRVALGEAFSAALACGFLGLMVSRGSSMLVEGSGGIESHDRPVGRRHLRRVRRGGGFPDGFHRLHLEPVGDRGGLHPSACCR